MKEQNETRKPDFRGEGISVWVTTKSDGEPFLYVKVLGNITLRAWKNKPKEPPKDPIDMLNC